MKAKKVRQVAGAMKAKKTVRAGGRNTKVRPAAAAKPSAARATGRSSSVSSITRKLDEVNWVPLESNPEMFTHFARHIGLPEAWSFVDVLGVDPELLKPEMVPRPCV